MEENMKNEKLNNGAKEIRAVAMTRAEKERMLQNILNSPVPSPFAPIASPFALVSFMAKIQRSRFFSYSIVACLFLFVSAGGIVSASHSSLPGSVFYPIKVQVLEPLASIFTFSLEERAKYESKLAVTRMLEAEILANREELDTPKQNIISGLLENHTSILGKFISQIQETNLATHKDNDIVIDFQAGMNAHAEILDILNKDNNAPELPRSSKISDTARASAVKIRSSLMNVKNRPACSYADHKNKDESLITDAVKGINSAANDSSPTNQEIIDATNQKIDKARQLIQEAAEDEERGDNDSAHSKLLDSESSAKEAGILLKTGLKLRCSVNLPR